MKNIQLLIVTLGTSCRPEVKIDWRVYTKPEKTLIRDLVIEVKFI